MTKHLTKPKSKAYLSPTLALCLCKLPLKHFENKAGCNNPKDTLSRLAEAPEQLQLGHISLPPVPAGSSQLCNSAVTARNGRRITVLQ